VPKSILDEAHRADHLATIAAAQRAAQVHPEFSSLKKVVPAAAAIAVATATASQITLPKKSEGPAMHKDVSELAHNMAKKQEPTNRA
jgi:stearoyl-CoA desaturase (delta-9 desaturase)